MKAHPASLPAAFRERRPALPTELSLTASQRYGRRIVTCAMLTTARWKSEDEPLRVFYRSDTDVL
jgi:hypothetical protein